MDDEEGVGFETVGQSLGCLVFGVAGLIAAYFSAVIARAHDGCIGWFVFIAVFGLLLPMVSLGFFILIWMPLSAILAGIFTLFSKKK